MSLGQRGFHDGQLVTFDQHMHLPLLLAKLIAFKELRSLYILSNLHNLGQLNELTNIYHRSLGCKALEVRGSVKQEHTSWSVNCHHKWKAWHLWGRWFQKPAWDSYAHGTKTRLLSSGTLLGPIMWALKLNSFIFSLLQRTGGNRLRVSQCAYELPFKMQLILPESEGNRHLNPGAL